MSDDPILERLNHCIKLMHNRSIRIMEVCGTHTRAVTKSGIRCLLPKEIQLLSGPGCPVCVTCQSFIDAAIEILDLDDTVIVAFGDIVKVKGTNLSLSDKQAQGSQVSVVYSPEDILTIADRNKRKSIVFAATGFETTAPLIAATVKLAVEQKLDNLFFLTALKRMEPVIRFILKDERNKVDALVCPGHVATIIGSDSFKFITDEFGVPAVVCGFETADITYGLCTLLEQLSGLKCIQFINLYKRCVSASGNVLARRMIEEVFDIADGEWRGIGMIKDSAMILNERYGHLDANKRFGIKVEKSSSQSKCFCSEILLGIKLPRQCVLFGSVCTPKNPFGPCMISAEGACATHYKYGGYEKNG